MPLPVITLENRLADIDFRRHDITSIPVASGNYCRKYGRPGHLFVLYSLGGYELEVVQYTFCGAVEHNNSIKAHIGFGP